jgi:glutathione peroxidase-family protein
VTALGEIAFDKTDGTTGTLADHDGEVVLVVNVASVLCWLAGATDRGTVPTAG